MDSEMNRVSVAFRYGILGRGIIKTAADGPTSAVRGSNSAKLSMNRILCHL
jgi:hypothetical protein